MPIEHKRRLSGTGFDFLVDYLNSKHSELSETIPMTEMDQEYAAENWNKVTIKEHHFREFEFNYEKKDLIPDENGKLIFFLDHSGPEWRYYRQHPTDETLYRRDDNEVSMTWSTLDPAVVSNLKLIDLKELRVDRFFSVYMNKYTNRMYERYMKVVNVFPGIKYDWNHLKHLSNGSKFEMEFKDEEGYYNTNWDGFWKYILQGGLNHLVDHFDREAKLFYSSGKGWMSRYPLLIEGTELNPFRIRYPFMSGTERCDEIYSSSQTFKFRDRETIEYMQENFAIQIDFKTIYGFLAFTNRVFFRGHIKNLTEKPGWSEAKKDFLESYLEIVQNAFNENKGKPDEMYKLLYFLPDEAVEQLGVSNLWEIIQYSAAVGITNIGTDKEDVVLKLLSVLAGIVTPEAFLHNLQVRKVGDRPLIERLVWRLDGYNFKAFVDLIRAVWMHSKYLIPEEGNPAYNEDYGPLMLYYTSDKTLGFHHDNATIKWTNDYKNIFVKIKEINIEAFENGDTSSLFKDEFYLYHPFAPIAITNSQNPEFIFKDSGQMEGAFQIMPAFVLLAREKSAFWSNAATMAEYATDILTVFSGVKGIIKAGRLFRAFNMGKSVLLRTKNFTYAASEIYGMVGAVEITAGVGNGLLKLTGIRDTEIGMAVSEVLLYLELAALTGEISAGIRIGLNKSTKKAIDKIDATRNSGKTDEILDAAEEAGAIHFLRTLQAKVTSIYEKVIEKLLKSGAIAEIKAYLIFKSKTGVIADLQSLNVRFFKVKNRRLFNSYYKSINPRVSTPGGAKVDFFAIHKGNEVFQGTKKEFQEFANDLNKTHKKGGKKAIAKALEKALEKAQRNKERFGFEEFKFHSRFDDHTEYGHIRIEVLDRNIPQKLPNKKPNPAAIVESYEYACGFGGRNISDKLPNQDFRIKAWGGTHMMKNIDGIHVRIASPKASLSGNLGTYKLPTGETIEKVQLEYFVSELSGPNQWKLKEDPTTMWPNSWPISKIKETVMDATNNIVEYIPRTSRFKGITKDGIQIEFFIDKITKEITTAYIVF